jgi:L-rhamnose mutarotase
MTKTTTEKNKTAKKQKTTTTELPHQTFIKTIENKQKIYDILNTKTIHIQCKFNKHPHLNLNAQMLNLAKLADIVTKAIFLDSNNNLVYNYINIYSIVCHLILFFDNNETITAGVASKVNKNCNIVCKTFADLQNLEGVILLVQSKMTLYNIKSAMDSKKQVLSIHGSFGFNVEYDNSEFFNYLSNTNNPLFKV